MPLPVQQKKDSLPVVCITGAGSVLVSHLAVYFAHHGYIPVILSRSGNPRSQTLLKKIQRIRPESIFIGADVSNEKDAKKAVKKIIRTFHRLDIVINTVGDFSYSTLNLETTENLRNTFESNVTTVWNMTKASLPFFRTQRKGLLINFGCAGAEQVTVREKTTLYYMAKSFVIGMTKAWAAENARYGIRMNVVSPGPLPTSVVRPKMPGGKPVQFADIMKAILFLIDTPSANGSIVEVTGGWIPGYRG